MNFLDADVPDPTDFPPQTVAPGLRTLDSSFRCNICGELYDAPVTISCGHCFCSACIRSSLALKQECPGCRKTSNEAHIRPNPALESVISSWKESRSYILDLIKRRKSHENTPSDIDNGTTKKRKRSVDSITDASNGNPAGPSRQSNMPDATRTSKPQSWAKKLKPQSDDGLLDITTIPSSDAEEELYNSGADVAPKADALVKCPLCQKRIQYGRLNLHMDNNCKDPRAPSEHNNNAAATSWSRIMSGGANIQSKNGQHKGKHKKRDSDSDDEYPLPLASYTTLKDKQLKDMLLEQGLPLTGDRSNWEQRHQRWVTIYNANLDRGISKRKNHTDLRRELKKWEDERGKRKKIVVKDTQLYQVEHKDEFTRLIQQAKGTAQAQKAKTKDSLPNTSSPPISVPDSSPNNADDVIVVDSEEEPLSQLPQ